MNEDYSDPNLHTLDEQLLIQDSLKKMQALWTESRPKSSPKVEYPYTDEQDQWHVVAFSVQDNSTPTPTFTVETRVGNYVISAESAVADDKANWDRSSTPMINGIYKRDPDQDGYRKASTSDIKELAGYLSQLDVEAVKLGYEMPLARRRQSKAQGIGNWLLRHSRSKPE